MRDVSGAAEDPHLAPAAVGEAGGALGIVIGGVVLDRFPGLDAVPFLGVELDEEVELRVALRACQLLRIGEVP